MGKRILFIGGNFSPEQTGIGKYSGEMLDWLSKDGFDCCIITTFPYYPQWKVQAPYTKSRFWYKKETVENGGKEGMSLSIIRCPHYVPKNPTGLKRVISDFTFFVTCSFVVIWMLFKKRFDFVFTVAPPFHLGLLAILYKKIRRAKCLYHIQDLQIEVAQNLHILKSKFFFNILLRMEKYILKSSDFVSTISEGMVKKIKIKCKKDILLLPNWVDVKKFFPIENRKDLKLLFNLCPEERVILYSGAIGEKQGLEAILHSAKHFESSPGIKFVICGSGPYKEKLLELNKSMALKNVVFMPLQPFEKLNYLLNVADVHLVLQKNGASDLTMPSKLSTIFSVGGVSIVTASAGSCLHDVINAANSGITIEPENQNALNSAIRYALTNDH
ncbi:MAG: WcaI family glycosyltransferase, partial [Ginsengibacter sp.]